MGVQDDLPIDREELQSRSDVGESLHLNNVPSFQHINAHFREGEALTLPFLNMKYNPIRIHVVSLSENQAISLNKRR
jgi:hypothetical protein